MKSLFPFDFLINFAFHGFFLYRTISSFLIKLSLILLFSGDLIKIELILLYAFKKFVSLFVKDNLLVFVLFEKYNKVLVHHWNQVSNVFFPVKICL